MRKYASICVCIDMRSKGVLSSAMSGVSRGGIRWGRRLGQVRADLGPRALAAVACLPTVLAGTGGPGGWR